MEVGASRDGGEEGLNGGVFGGFGGRICSAVCSGGLLLHQFRRSSRSDCGGGDESQGDGIIGIMVIETIRGCDLHEEALGVLWACCCAAACGAAVESLDGVERDAGVGD